MKRRNAIVGLGLCLGIIGTVGFVPKQKVSTANAGYLVTRKLSRNETAANGVGAAVGYATGVGGAAWGAQVGAEIGFIGGPVGSVIGGAFGAACGYL